MIQESSVRSTNSLPRSSLIFWSISRDTPCSPLQPQPTEPGIHVYSEYSIVLYLYRIKQMLRPLSLALLRTASRRLDPAALAMADTHNETQALAEEPEDSQPSDSTGSLSCSSWSPAWEELVASIAFFILCMIPYLVAIAPRIRPIPFQRIQSGEYIRNLVNNESFESDTISTLVLFLISALLPFGLQLIHVARTSKKTEDKLHTVCVYLVGFGLTLLVTESIKSYVAYLRPSFYDLCEPAADYTICTAAGDSSDARKSFPSGHASTAFCGLSLFSKYLERTFGIESVREIAIENTALVIRCKTGSAPKYNRLYSILCLLPVALAIFIAASRVVDNKHFPADIVGGCVLGAACASFANRLWFPSLF